MSEMKEVSETVTTGVATAWDNLIVRAIRRVEGADWVFNADEVRRKGKKHVFADHTEQFLWVGQPILLITPPEIHMEFAGFDHRITATFKYQFLTDEGSE
jgi:hypothetical protein